MMMFYTKMCFQISTDTEKFAFHSEEYAKSSARNYYTIDELWKEEEEC